MHFPDIKISKSPAARLGWIEPGFEEPSLLPRQEGDIELFQREVEPIASSLHIGFLSGPASKKCVVPGARWQVLPDLEPVDIQRVAIIELAR